MKQIPFYKLRPAYGSKELLIEFNLKSNIDELIQKLTELLEANGFKFDGIRDVWMNDEFWFHFSSENGGVILSKDIYDIVFITGENNQKDILRIDEILKKHDAYLRQDLS